VVENNYTQSGAFEEFAEFNVPDYIYELNFDIQVPTFSQKKFTAGDLLNFQKEKKNFKKVYKIVNLEKKIPNKISKINKEEKSENLELQKNFDEKISNIQEHINKKLSESNSLNGDQIKDLELNLKKLKENTTVDSHELKKIEERIIATTKDLADDLQEKINIQNKFLENFLK